MGIWENLVFVFAADICLDSLIPTGCRIKYLFIWVLHGVGACWLDYYLDGLATSESWCDLTIMVYEHIISNNHEAR